MIKTSITKSQHECKNIQKINKYECQFTHQCSKNVMVVLSHHTHGQGLQGKKNDYI